MKTDAFGDKKSTKAIGNLAKTHGFRGFYRGAVGTVLRDAPYAGLFFATYNNLKHEPHIGVTGAAFLSSIFASLATQPFDIMRLRMQTREPSVSGPHVIAMILRNEQFSAIFRGLTMRILKRSLSGMITWTAFENMMR